MDRPTFSPSAALLGSANTAGSEQADSVNSFVFQRQGKKNIFFGQMADFARRYGTDAIPRLKEFLQDPDWEVRCAALRALGLIESEETKTILLGYIREDVSVEESAQASLTLGEMNDPRVTPLLVAKFEEVKGEDLRRALLDSLTGRPFDQTSGFFREYLNSPGTPSEEKGHILAGLGFHQSAPAGMLAGFITDPDENVRQGAYEGLAARREARYGQMLLGRISQEQDPALREKVYEAAGAQEDTLPAQMAAVARQESDPAARLRANRAWAMTIGRTANVEDRRRFNQEAVPWLLQEALQNPDPGEQRAALQALAMARTEASGLALEKIAQETSSSGLRQLATALAAKIRKNSSSGVGH